MIPSGDEASLAASSVRLPLMQPRESGDTVSQVSLVHDVITVEHRSSLVAGKLHGHALRHAGAHQIADRGSAKVVGDSAQYLGSHDLPDAGTITSGRYPIWSYEHMFTYGAPKGQVAAFIEFVRGRTDLVAKNKFIPIAAMHVKETDR